MGFDVAVQFKETVALMDVRGTPESMKSVLTDLGMNLPETPYSMLRRDSGTVYRVGRKWCIIVTAMSQELNLFADLDNLSKGLLVQCTCVTDFYRGIDLTGPDTREVLSQITSLNLHEFEEDSATFTEIFGLRGFIIRHGAEHYTVFCERSYADYTMKRILKCALLRDNGDQRSVVREAFGGSN